VASIIFFAFCSQESLGLIFPPLAKNVDFLFYGYYSVIVAYVSVDLLGVFFFCPGLAGILFPSHFQFFSLIPADRL